MTISLCTFLRAVSYGLLLPFYVCGTELRRSLQRQGLQPVVLVLALTVILQWEQTFATLGGQYVGIVCSIALYAITAYALLRRSIGLALQQALCMLGTDLNKKERTFCVIAYLPKATVQAAIGSVPLSMGLSCGKIVLSVAVLAILITAPLGALGMDATYRKLLQKNGENNII